MILLVDNYDSFVFNLARYFGELGEDVRVERNDAISVGGIREAAPTHLVLSPGPCTPAEAGVCLDAVRELSREIPVLGVCLGHQCIAAAFGGAIVRARRPMHGIVCDVEHGGAGLFAGLPSPLEVTRYHSLVVAEAGPGDGIRVTARSGDGEVMGIEHASRPLWGVQFHPEAAMTFGGHRLLANFLALGRGGDPGTVPVDATRCRELT